MSSHLSQVNPTLPSTMTSVTPTEGNGGGQQVERSRRLRIDTIPGVFNVLSVTEENGMIIVKTHEEYTVHYVTSRNR